MTAELSEQTAEIEVEIPDETFILDAQGTAWRGSVACRGATDEDMCFDVKLKGRGTKPSPPEAAAIIKYCVTCPVREECLRDAVFTNVKHGIRGGMTTKQRTALAKTVDKDTKVTSIGAWNEAIDQALESSVEVNTTARAIKRAYRYTRAEDCRRALLSHLSDQPEGSMNGFTGKQSYDRLAGLLQVSPSSIKKVMSALISEGKIVKTKNNEDVPILRLAA